LQNQDGGEGSVVATVKEMMNTFHDKLSVEGENYVSLYSGSLVWVVYFLSKSKLQTGGLFAFSHFITTD
jgi:hypothetical protein